MAGRLAYDDHGRGLPVLLIHGYPFDRRMWALQVKALSTALRVIAPDLPGYGASPRLSEKTAMSELAESLRSLLDELEVGRSVVVGLSMGGLVART